MAGTHYFLLVVIKIQSTFHLVALPNFLSGCEMSSPPFLAKNDMHYQNIGIYFNLKHCLERAWHCVSRQENSARILVRVLLKTIKVRNKGVYALVPGEIVLKRMTYKTIRHQFSQFLEGGFWVHLRLCSHLVPEH